MPPKKAEPKVTRKRKSPKKRAQSAKKKVIVKDDSYHMKKWLDGVSKSLAHHDFQYDSELKEINSDEESDDAECNLKNLEVNSNP
jgi:hypothetical protein